jgi:starch synthase
MRLCYTLLSPTWGMHQYTADLANRMSTAGHDVTVVTTGRAPRDRYSPAIRICTPLSLNDRGFSRQGLALWRVRSALRAIVQQKPQVVHFAGPHLWNPLLLVALRRAGIPTVHTIHDLHPHVGAAYGRLLYVWNLAVMRASNHLVVHGERYRDELIQRGESPDRIACSPLTFLCFSHALERAVAESMPDLQYEPWALFLGRLEPYKGLDVLLQAARDMPHDVVVAGPGKLKLFYEEEIPRNYKIRNHLIEDEEAIDLFRRCGAVILPYIEASQSANIATAYYFRKPVVVTRAGALPEYVVEGETGWVIRPNDPHLLATTLQFALSDPARLERMGRAGRAWYERHREADTQTLLNMYARIASQTHPLP